MENFHKFLVYIRVSTLSELKIPTQLFEGRASYIIQMLRMLQSTISKHVSYLYDIFGFTKWLFFRMKWLRGSDRMSLCAWFGPRTWFGDPWFKQSTYGLFTLMDKRN